MSVLLLEVLVGVLYGFVGNVYGYLAFIVQSWLVCGNCGVLCLVGIAGAIRLA